MPQVCVRGAEVTNVFDKAQRQRLGKRPKLILLGEASSSRASQGGRGITVGWLDFVCGGASTANAPLWMPHFSDEEIRAAVVKAERRRSYVMAHCHTDDGARRCVQHGVRSIEHGSEILPETAEAIAEHDMFVVPTITAADVIFRHGRDLGLPESSIEKIRELQDKMLESVETCARAGVRLGLGTDLHGHEHHKAQGRELVLRGEVNRPVEVLRSATSVNAELLQMSGELGVLKPGALADLIVLDGDPLESVSLFDQLDQHLRLVMKDGQLVRSDL